MKTESVKTVRDYCPECQEFTDQEHTVLVNEVAKVIRRICCKCKYDAGTTTQWIASNTNQSVHI